jgi:hypothetical protein
MKGQVVMHAEEERIDMLVRRFMFTGMMLCAMVVSGALLSTLVA